MLEASDIRNQSQDHQDFAPGFLEKTCLIAAKGGLQRFGSHLKQVIVYARRSSVEVTLIIYSAKLIYLK